MLLHRVVVPLILLATAGVGCRYRASAEDLRLPDLTGQYVTPLKEIHARAIVFLFTRTDCPVSNRYAPEVRRLVEKFSASNVDFWLVYPDPGESAEAIRAHIRDFDYRCGVLRDPEHVLVKKTGVRVTPEAAVFVDAGRMVYRGRIDDLYVDFGRTRAAPTKHDLREVLEMIIEGRPAVLATTSAVGCYIPDLQ